MKMQVGPVKLGMHISGGAEFASVEDSFEPLLQLLNLFIPKKLAESPRTGFLEDADFAKVWWWLNSKSQQIGGRCLMWQDIAMLKTTIWRTVIFSALMLSVGIALPSTDSIYGTVKDSEGAVIRGARITVILDSSVSGSKEGADMVTTSDKNGQFALEVAPGFYDIFVSAPAFSPQCTKVRVREAEPAIYMPRLHADPLVIKERGDTFSN